jgi:flagellar hook-length control protein FliK
MSLMPEVAAAPAQNLAQRSSKAQAAKAASSPDPTPGPDDTRAKADFAAQLQKHADARRAQQASTPSKDTTHPDKRADKPKDDAEDASAAAKAKPASPDATDPPAAQALALLQPAQLAAAANAAGQARGTGVDTLQAAAARWGAGHLPGHAGDGVLGAASAGQGLGAGGHAALGSLKAGLAEAGAQAVTSAALQATPTPQTADATPGLLPSLGPLTDPSAQPSHAAPADAPGAPSASAQLPLSPSSPAFGAALSQQLSHWLRDGIQHAQVELHPSNLGPISVQISVDDGQTHIALGADVASTRQALTDAMPQLAQSLRDVGLTLTGGGVFDQSRGQMPQAPGTPGRNASSTAGGDADGGLTVGSSVRVQTQRGLLDLYA